MSAFAVYAIVLTGAYILYYTVIICLDLFKKEGKKDTAETINVVDDEASQETSRVVSETEDGYSFVDDSVPEEEETSDNDEDEEEGSENDSRYMPSHDSMYDESSAEEDVSYDDEEDLEEESAESLAAYERAKEVQQQMQHQVPTAQAQYDSTSFAFLMSQPSSAATKIVHKIIAP